VVGVPVRDHPNGPVREVEALVGEREVAADVLTPVGDSDEIVGAVPPGRSVVDPDEVRDPDVETGLLARLADRRLLGGFAGFGVARGETPRAVVDALHHQQAALVVGDDGLRTGLGGDVAEFVGEAVVDLGGRALEDLAVSHRSEFEQALVALPVVGVIGVDEAVFRHHAQLLEQGERVHTGGGMAGLKPPANESRPMTLVAFDFDGTLSNSEMTVLLGERLEVAGEMAEITERAMNDEMSYAESLRQRAGLLKGLPQADAEVAYGEVRLRPGAAEVIESLNEAGVHTAILTGGFERGVERALAREGVAVDSIVANRLPMADGKLTGEVEGPLIEGTKDDALRRLASAQGVDPEDTVAVGDGANDLPMLRVAGLAVGFDPKPAVEPHCDELVTDMVSLRRLFEERGVLEPAAE
jgi:phosphoserine phosphatase